MERIVVGISGASGAPLAVRFLQALRDAGVESHVVVTDGGIRTLEAETGLHEADILRLANRVYDVRDIGAGPASGTWESLGMAVIPCSMKTLAGIWCGYSDNLLLRAADVTLKEGHKLVLAVRDAPFSPIHLRNMHELSMMGAVILPPVMSFYQRPRTLEEMTDQYVGRVLNAFGIRSELLRRWNPND